MITNDVNIMQSEDGLRIRLTEEGKQRLAKLFRDEMLTPALEKFGLTHIYPDELDALTGCPFIYGLGVDYDDDGVTAEALYWYPQYAILDPIEELMTTGTITLTLSNRK